MVRKYEPVGGRYGRESDDRKKQSSSSNSHPNPSSNRRSSKTDSPKAPKSLNKINTERSPRVQPRHGPNPRFVKNDPVTRFHAPSRNYVKEYREKRRSSRDERGSKTPPDAGNIASRKEIDLVTMNMSGSNVMGLTPKYKVNMIRDFLETFPDAVFFQDSIEQNELVSVLLKVSDGKYEYYFQDLDEEDERNESYGGHGSRSVTGIAWNSEKYLGTPLQLDDDRLGEHVPWLNRHNLSVVKLDSKERAGIEDVYPSVIAISWHGPDYNYPLKQRSRECEEFFSFLKMLREKNWHIPIIIGGDFNMDMKSFDMKDYKEFVLVPYRPVSGTLAKDLKNTFMFTMDSLQVTETGFKQHHPEIFSCPFITVKVRGRNQIKIWAVVRIQRCLRKWMRKKKEREENKKKLNENKKRWRKKIEGDDYVSDNEGYSRSNSRQESRRSKSFDANSYAKSFDDKIEEKKEPRKDRKYCLYWDPEDDPRYEKKEQTSEDRQHRRRKDFNEGKRDVIEDMYNKPMTIAMNGHRRKKYGDLKSIHDRKKEAESGGGDDNYYRNGL